MENYISIVFQNDIVRQIIANVISGIILISVNHLISKVTKKEQSPSKDDCSTSNE